MTPAATAASASRASRSRTASTCRSATPARTESTVTPHASFIALDVSPQAAYANIQKLRSLYPDIYTHDGGFYDAVNPSTG